MEKFKQFLTTTGGRIVMTVFFAAIIFGIFLLCTALESTVFAIIVFAFCAYFGWQVLNAITPNIFLFMGWGAWIAYFVIKAVLAFLIGFFVAPFVVAKKISDKISSSVE